MQDSGWADEGVATGDRDGHEHQSHGMASSEAA